MKIRFARFGELNEMDGTYILSAYLIPQFGKTFHIRLLKTSKKSKYDKL